MLKDYTLGRLFKLRDKINFLLGKLIFDKNLVRQADAESSNSILFIRGDGKLGDSIVSSFIYREIKQQRPDMQIGVLCTENSEHLFTSDPFIDRVHCYPKRAKLWQVKSRVAQLPSYDVVVSFAEILKARDLLLLRCLKARFNIGIVEGLGLINYNIATRVKGKHCQQYFVEVARCIGVEPQDLSYRFTLPDAVEQSVLQFLGDKKGRYLAINPFGNAAKRSFTPKRLTDTLQALRQRFPELPLVVLASPSSQTIVDQVLTQIDGVYSLPKTTSFEQSAALIKHCKLLISVDTATVHLAHCFHVPMVAIYRQDPENFAMWAPNYQPTKAIFARAAVNEVEEVNISEFDLDELIEAITHLLSMAN